MSNRILGHSSQLHDLFPGAAVRITYGNPNEIVVFLKKNNGKWLSNTGVGDLFPAHMFGGSTQVELLADGTDPDVDLRDGLTEVIENIFPDISVSNGNAQKIINGLRAKYLLPTPEYVKSQF